MFTGIIEEVGEVVYIVREGANLCPFVKCTFTKELKIDQSAARSGVHLTVAAIDGDVYQATAIAGTSVKTHLGSLQAGDIVNLECGMSLNTCLDGHIVQGHIDQTAACTAIRKEGGSKRFSFTYDLSTGNVVIEKGSVAINRVSLTVVDVTHGGFSVTVIPYTLAHTNLHCLAIGSVANLEFGVIGKHAVRLVQQR